MPLHENSYSVSAVSDSDGNYQVDGARWGPNEVKVYHPNYEGQKKYTDIIRDEAVELDFELDRIPDTVDPVITVFVTDPAGMGISNARVDLYEKELWTFEWYTFVDSQTTDDAGYAEFEVSALYEHNIRFYRLKVSAAGFYNTTKDFSVTWSVYNPQIHVKMNPAP